MANIAKLNVALTANTSGFTAGMSMAARTLSVVQSAYAKATDQAAAYDRMQGSIGQLKLAGAETLTSLQTVLAVARSEIRKFSNNMDVRVAVEIAREQIDEAWIKAKPQLQRLVDASRIKVAAQFVADKSTDVRAWIDQQRRSLTKPITVRVELARRAIAEQVDAAKAKLDGLKQYRAVRIGLAAINGMKMPVSAAMAALGPLTRLGGRGVVVALRATHLGVAVGVNKAKALLSGLLSHGRSVASGITGMFTSLAGGVGGIAAMLGGTALVGGLGGIVGYSIKLAADAEQARVSFTTMLGDANQAKALIGQINQFAATTPFQTPELIDASKKLLAFGVSAEQIIPTMRSLGDVSAGLNIPIGELAELYGKAKVQGRLMAEDINQLTGRGIPVIGEFARQFGVSEGEVRKLVETGKIGFPQLQQAIVSLTTGSGKFAGMMSAQSLTVAGLFSTLQDTVTLNLTRIGETITEKLDLRAVLSGITTAIDTMASTAMPIIEAFIGGLAASGNVGQQAGNLVLSASEFIATGLAYVIDYSKLLVVAFKSMQAGAALAIGGVLKAVDFLGAGIVKLLNYLPGVSLQWTDTLGAMGDAVLDEANKLAGEAGDAWDSFANNDSAKRVGQFFNQVRANAAKAQQATAGVGDAAQQTAMQIEKSAVQQNAKVIDSLKDLQEQVQQFGLSDNQKKMHDLVKDGANATQLGQAQKLLDLQDRLTKLSSIDTGDPMTTYAAKMEALQKLYAQGLVTEQQFEAIRKSASTTLTEKLTESAKSITEGVKTPLERYQEEVDKLNVLLERGLITQQTFDRAKAQAQGKLDEGNQPAAPKLFKSNTADAQRFVYDSTRGITSQSKDDPAKKTLKEQQKGNALLERLERNTRPSGLGKLAVYELQG
ncbi:MAG: tape measure protein [Tepidisphaeraceae bacterium]